MLEQSLDIDADFLVSRICPTDMLFQRIGRLWRHRLIDPLRHKEACREAWILTPGLTEAIANEEEFGKTAFVYAPYVLCRTLEVWQGRDIVKIPSQIREMLEETYCERSAENNRMTAYKHLVEQTREKLRTHALIGVSRGGNTLPENKASTRYSDEETCDVLLFRARSRQDDGVHVRFLDGTSIVLQDTPKQKGREAWRATAAALQRNTVRVNEKRAPRCTRTQLKWLSDYLYIGEDNENPPCRAALVEPSGELIGIDQEKPLAGYKLSYNSTLGYFASKDKDPSSFE